MKHRVKMFLLFPLMMLLTFVGGSSLSSCSLFNNKNNEGDQTSLVPVKNLRINESNFTFTWDSVDGASGYRFETSIYQYSEWSFLKSYDVNSNSIQYTPSFSKMRFRVIAKDVANTNWSEYLEYEIKHQELNKANILEYCQNLKIYYADYICVDVVDVLYYTENKVINDVSYNRGILQFDAVFEERNHDVYHLLSLQAVFLNPIASIKECILNQTIPDYQSSETPHGVIYVTKHGNVLSHYDSLPYYLQSHTYKEAMQVYKNEGYTFTSLKCQGAALENTTYYVYGVLLLSKGDERLYYACGLTFYYSGSANLNEEATVTTTLTNFPNTMIDLDVFKPIDSQCLEVMNYFLS